MKRAWNRGLGVLLGSPGVVPPLLRTHSPLTSPAIVPSLPNTHSYIHTHHKLAYSHGFNVSCFTEVFPSSHSAAASQAIHNYIIKTCNQHHIPDVRIGSISTTSNVTATAGTACSGYSSLFSNRTLNVGWVGRLVLPGGLSPSMRHYSSKHKSGLSNIHSRISSLQVKKRVQRKKQAKADTDEEAEDTVGGFSPVARHKFLTFDPDFAIPEVHEHRPPPREWQVTAYATADEYNLEQLMAGLTQQGLYTLGSNQGQPESRSPFSSPGRPTPSSSVLVSQPDPSEVLHVVAAYQLETEPREIYFFQEGSVVFWNVPELEQTNVMRFLQRFESGHYDDGVIQEECESLTYKYSDAPSKTKLIKDNHHYKILMNVEGQTDLEKYTVSNVMAMSVKLGSWEASLDTYIDNIEYVSEELSKTGHVVLSQDQVLQRMGQLFALRHLINLSSDLLDVPDFYWEHEDLEQLYKKTSDHLSISKRTSVMNVKLSHCIELMELLKSHLDEKHSARLEWIIIILIMVEVGFELLHFLERLL